MVFDTGCFILIWLVQLVIYPSFRYYHPPNLSAWHFRYTKKITLVVLPLMLGQLILGILQAATSEFTYLLKLVLILSTWLLTFTVFVPLHNKIDQTDKSKEVTIALVNKNWMRTALWSLIFILSIMDNFRP